jgi:hypothetical protein
VKAWQWYSGQVNTDKDNFEAFFEDKDNKNKWWTPDSQMTSEIKAPFLLALPNAMVEILRELGGGIYPSQHLGSNGGSKVANGRRSAQRPVEDYT